MLKLIQSTLSLMFTLILLDSAGQSRGVVTDSVTRQPVPFVNIWVDGESIGTTSNENGEYLFSQNIMGKRIVLSSIGYKKRIIVVNSEHQSILLQPEAIRLKEIVVSSKRKTKAKLTKVGDDFKLSETKRFFFCGESPYMAARYFPSDERYSKTPYLSGIEIITSSPRDSVSFNLRLYTMNEQGEPGHAAYSDNIIVTTRKGINLTAVDLSDRGILFPERGLLVAFEFLIIESNKYVFKVPDQKEQTAYVPALGTFPVENEDSSWIYYQGSWQRTKRNQGVPQQAYDGRYSNVAIRITLSD